MFQNFKDKRHREWEWFVDVGYYHMTCVRVLGERDFNSALSFHFASSTEAEAFVKLLEVSC